MVSAKGSYLVCYRGLKVHMFSFLPLFRSFRVSFQDLVIAERLRLLQCQSKQTCEQYLNYGGQFR